MKKFLKIVGIVLLVVAALAALSTVEGVDCCNGGELSGWCNSPGHNDCEDEE